jgi:hypothetical protein
MGSQVYRFPFDFFAIVPHPRKARAIFSNQTSLVRRKQNITNRHSLCFYIFLKFPLPTIFPFFVPINVGFFHFQFVNIADLGPGSIVWIARISRSPGKQCTDISAFFNPSVCAWCSTIDNHFGRLTRHLRLRRSQNEFRKTVPARLHLINGRRAHSVCAESELTCCMSQPNCGQFQTANFAL